MVNCRPARSLHSSPTPATTSTTLPAVQAAELQRRLEAEMPRQQLDLRHRLDKDGQRYGKVIDWK